MVWGGHKKEGILMARQLAFRKKKNNRLGMLCVSFVVLALFAVLMIRGLALKAEVDEYEEQEAVIEKQIAEEEERTQSLNEYEKYTKTDKYVEEIAKEKLGLVYDDEILFKSDVEE